MRVVLDTNVLVSGLLSPHGTPAKIVTMASGDLIRLCYDGRILAEYREVLSRSKFHFDPDDVNALLEQIESCGYATAGQPLRKSLPDIDDEPFLEVALAGKAECLITGNLKHYPVGSREGIKVVEPIAFLDLYRKSKE